ICFIACSGYSAFASHSAECGAISFWAKSRASSTISCVMTSLVLIESLATLSSQLPRRDHLPQERARPVLVVTQPAVQHLEDRDAYVEPDQVRQGQRSERMVHPQLHDGVDRFRGGYTLHDTINRFIDHGH